MRATRFLRVAYRSEKRRQAVSCRCVLASTQRVSPKILNLRRPAVAPLAYIPPGGITYIAVLVEDRIMEYLLNTEPGAYSFADLQREKATLWDGVTNPVA